MSKTYTVNRGLSDGLNTSKDLLFNIDTGSLCQNFGSLHLKAVDNKCELARQCDICKLSPLVGEWIRLIPSKLIVRIVDHGGFYRAVQDH